MSRVLLVLALCFLPLSLGQSVYCSCYLSGEASTKLHYDADANGEQTWLGVYSLYTGTGPGPRCPSAIVSYTITNFRGTYGVQSSDLYGRVSLDNQYKCVLWEGKYSNCTKQLGYDTFNCPRQVTRTPPPSNSGLFVAIFVPISVVVVIVIIVVVVICVRRAQQKRAAQMATYSRVPTSPIQGATSPLQYAPAPMAPSSVPPTMTFIPAPFPTATTGVQPPTYMMSTPGAGTMQPMVYMPQGDPTMSSGQPVFIATATNPARPQ